MQTPNALAFYICPHQDDWIFFRGEFAYSDLQNPNNRVVIVFLTAGGAGLTDGWWEAREAGAIAAINAAAPSPATSPSPVPITGTLAHNITKYEFGNGACYCLRLPENKDSPNPTSLLTNSPPSVSLQAVDNSTTYESWQDLCETIKSIVELERSSANIQNPWINAPLYITNDVIDCGNHPDHIATGIAVRSFAKDFCNRAWWWSYAIEGRSDMRIDDRIMFENKHTLFNAYYDTVKTRVEQNGNPEGSLFWVNELPQEWEKWGAYGHAELANYGTPDPYTGTGTQDGKLLFYRG